MSKYLDMSLENGELRKYYEDEIITEIENKVIQNIILGVYKNYVDEKETNTHETCYIFQEDESHKTFMIVAKSVREALYKLSVHLSKTDSMFMATFIYTMTNEPYIYHYKKDGIINLKPKMLGELIEMATYDMQQTTVNNDYCLGYQIIPYQKL